MEYIRNKRLLALIGIVSLILGTLLPYFTFNLLGYSSSISLWRYWEGKVIMVLIIANAMFIFKDLIEKYVPQLFNTNLGSKIANIQNPKVSLVPTILIVVFVVYLYLRLNINAQYLKNGIGFYLLWLGIISLVGHSLFYKKSYKQDQVNYNQNFNSQQQVHQTQPQEFNQQNMSTTGVKTDKKYCPQCRNQVDSSANFCFMCGQKFE